MNSRNIKGFSLVELTVVLLIITLLAGVALRSTNELSFQVRYEQTQERLQRIREAILGNPRQIINGQQAVSGFVADMGRLPQNLRELIDNNSAHSDCDLDNTKDLDLDGNPALDICLPWSATDNPGNLGVGWRGPYINISGNPSDSNAFSDAWGRTAGDNNYGWIWLTNAPNPLDLTLGSYGKDQNPGGNCSDSDYNGDCFEHILVSDYKTDVSSGLTLNVRGVKFNLDSHCSNAMYTTRADCEANAGDWYGGCSESNGGTPSYSNKDTCPAGKWSSCSITTHTTQAACEADVGIWYGDGYGCSDPTKPDKASCEAIGAAWYGCSDKNQSTRAACEATVPASNWFDDGSPTAARRLCLSVYYRKDGAIFSLESTSTPDIVEDDGNHNLSFSFPPNSSISNGQISIGLYYQRGSDGCQKNMPYPLNSKPLPVMVYAHSTLPVINW